VVSFGYDDDFDLIDRDDPRPRWDAVLPAPGWRAIEFDEVKRRVRIPLEVRIDLGSSGKAFAADLAARRIAAQLSCGVLVNFGRGHRNDGRITEWWMAGRHPLRLSNLRADVGLVVALHSGGLASSGTKCATGAAAASFHHIVDLRTRDIARRRWTLATLASSTCLYANAASTAAIVMSAQATEWIAELEFPARLVDDSGVVTRLRGWPDDPPAREDARNTSDRRSSHRS
jgi:FAD:protein FMN transferase